VLLSVLIAVALMMVLYTIQWEGMGDSVGVLNKNPSSDQPWRADWRLEERHLKEIADEALGIDADIYIKSKVHEDVDKRGSMEFYITREGQVAGTWTGEYETVSRHSDRIVTHEVFSADFEGIVDPSKMFSDNELESSDYLYIYTKGYFTLVETNDRNQVRRISGEVFVVGWLDIDNSAFGSLHLTSDRKAQWIYDWKGKESSGY
jgi:hypothetical protein